MGALRWSLLLFPQSGKSAEPRQQRSSRQLRRQPGDIGRKAGSAALPGRQSGQPARHFLRQFLHLFRTRHGAAEAEHVGEPRHGSAFARSHRLHHVGHTAVHLEHAVDVFDFGAGARSDTLLAARLEQVGIFALLRRHGIDDRHLALEQALVEVRRLELILHFGDAGEHAHQPGHAAHLLHLHELLAQVREIERPLAHLFGDPRRLLRVDRRRRLLDQRDDVAHAEDAVGDARGMEILERVHLLAGTDELDRLARHRPHGECGAAGCPATTGKVSTLTCRPSTASCSIAAGRRTSSDAMRTLRRACSARRLASLAVVVVLPEPCRPTIMIGTGAGALRSTGSPRAPSVSISWSCTIFTTIWPGVTDLMTSTPTAWLFTLSMKARATSSATSASSSARRTSRRAASTSTSVSAPRRVRRSRMPPSLSESESNIVVPATSSFETRPSDAPARTCKHLWRPRPHRAVGRWPPASWTGRRLKFWLLARARGTYGWGAAKSRIARVEFSGEIGFVSPKYSFPAHALSLPSF